MVRARDQVLERDVTFKTILPELAQDPELVERFLAEARHNGQLDHPNIVPVHHLGTDAQKLPYFTASSVSCVGRNSF